MKLAQIFQKKKFDRKLRSTIYKHYKPYIILHGKKFFV